MLSKYPRYHLISPLYRPFYLQTEEDNQSYHRAGQSRESDWGQACKNTTLSGVFLQLPSAYWAIFLIFSGPYTPSRSSGSLWLMARRLIFFSSAADKKASPRGSVPVFLMYSTSPAKSLIKQCPPAHLPGISPSTHDV